MKYANLDKICFQRILNILIGNRIKLYLIDLSGFKSCSISLLIIKAAFEIEKLQKCMLI